MEEARVRDNLCGYVLKHFADPDGGRDGRSKESHHDGDSSMAMLQKQWFGTSAAGQGMIAIDSGEGFGAEKRQTLIGLPAVPVARLIGVTVFPQAA
jgi:hypothetical protein